MSVSHHLDDATLMAYASGDLSEAFSVVVAAHLSMCETCRKAARSVEELGGQLLDDVDEVALSSSAFDKMMAAIDSAETEAPAVAEIREPIVLDSNVPLPLQRFIGTDIGDVRWRPIAPGVRKHAIKLDSKGSDSLYMLHIAPGMAVPEHGHGGSELTLVLSGAYRDVFGRFGAGDIADLDEHIEHQPKVEAGEACICIVATEAPTKFKDVFSRVLQPLTGI